jgi:DNA polymerase III sliding clamp (beta) subunit (PCNA family)
MPVQQCTSAINKNTPLQSCLLLHATEETFTITALDTRTSQLTLKVPEAVTFQVGRALVNADTLNHLLSTFPDEPITLSVDEQKNLLTLQVGNVTTDIELFNEPPSAFPVNLDLPPMVTTIDGERFSECIKKAMLLSGNKNEFITIKANTANSSVDIYTSHEGRLFSRTTVQALEESYDWSVAIPTYLFGKLPRNMVGEAELCIDNKTKDFAIVSGPEHLVIHNFATDNTSTHIDTIIDMQPTGSFVIKSDALNQDIKRAMFINDRRGLKLSPDGQRIKATCGTAGKAHIRGSYYDINYQDGDLEVVNIDPKVLSRALGGLGANTLVIEQLKTEIPSIDPNEEPDIFYNLRIQDEDQPEFRQIIMTTLAVT